MRRLIRLDGDEVRPSDTDVLRRLAAPLDVEPSPQLRRLLEQAKSILAADAEPRAIVQTLTAPEFDSIHRGEGRNAEPSPLQEIYPRAAALALFVATIGDRIERKVASLFRDADPALAFVLDTFASATVNRTVDVLAGRFAAESSAEMEARVLPYSPGYCGWHLTGQRALFASLHPEEIGVSLRTSCLMDPIKSVSGVMVAGEPAVHRFRPSFSFCAECATRECIPRMASVRR